MAGLDFTEILIGMTVLIASLSFHEAAHAWAADRLGDPTARMLGRLSLNPVVHVDPIGTLLFPLIAISTGVPLIGWAKPVPVNTRHLRSPKRDFALIAAAGPASNLVLAIAGAGAISVLPDTGILGNALVSFVVLNVLLAVFNMVPVPPLDGGNVLIGLLPHGAASVVEQLRPYGFLLLYGLMLSGVLYRLIMPIGNAILTWLL